MLMLLNVTIHRLFNYLLTNIYINTQNCIMLIYINVNLNKKCNVITFFLFKHLLQCNYIF